MKLIKVMLPIYLRSKRDRFIVKNSKKHRKYTIKQVIFNMIIHVNSTCTDHITHFIYKQNNVTSKNNNSREFEVHRRLKHHIRINQQ